MEDDGRGLNIEKIKQKALDNHILNQDGLDKLSPQQVMQLIFHSGFSTADVYGTYVLAIVLTGMSAKMISKQGGIVIT